MGGGVKTASWVIVSLLTGDGVVEIWSPEIIAKVNKKKYKAVPILEYLQEFARKAKEQNDTARI